MSEYIKAYNTSMDEKIEALEATKKVKKALAAEERKLANKRELAEKLAKEEEEKIRIDY